MCCNSFEERILTYEANLLPSPEREAVERHVVTCSNCRQFLAQLRELDAALERDVNRPALSPQFSERVRQRIHEHTACLPQAVDLAQRKRRLELEYEVGRATLRQDAFRLIPLLTGLGYAALVAVAAWLFSQYILAGIGASLDMLSSMSLPAGSLPVAPALCLLFVAGMLLWPQARRWAFR